MQIFMLGFSWFTIIFALDIRFERRKLHIGDYVWIAQQRSQPVPGTVMALDACLFPALSHLASLLLL